VGAARFLQGLVQVVPAEQITAVVNTGDDVEMHGLHVSPDLDTVTYALAGLVDNEKGWGLRGDTYHCQDLLANYGEPTWFRLGDRDLATSIFRTALLRQGLSLSAVADQVRRGLGVAVRLLPMTDDPVQTEIVTPDGALAFQDYFVRRQQQDEVVAVRFRGIEAARVAAPVRHALELAPAVVIAPSNPFVSIGPILALPGLRTMLQTRRSSVVAITPIIGGAAVKGPADRMLRSLGVEVSAVGVASLYQDVAATFILDQVDAGLAPRIEALGMRPIVMRTLMRDLADKRVLAEAALEAVGKVGGGALP
jgi:LPPG:FO 2-phospho-L-lactate transferase